MLDSTRSQQPKLLDEVRNVLRLHHYSIHTERSYVEWIVRFVRFHAMQSRTDLFPAEPKIEVFLTDLAVRGEVAPATQNQAMNALVFLYKGDQGSRTPRRADEENQRPHFSSFLCYPFAATWDRHSHDSAITRTP